MKSKLGLSWSATAVFLLAVITATSAALANGRSISAARDPQVSYEAYIDHQFSHKKFGGTKKFKSVYESAVAFEHLNLEDSAALPKGVIAQDILFFIRDIQFIADPVHDDLIRRSSWLFPDDGCYARADLARQNILAKFKFEIKKIFVFGDLTVKTENSPSGSVSWWYHVAPIVKSKNSALVLDPAIDPRAPLPIGQWLQAQSNEIDNLSIAICSGASYDPDDSCDSKRSQDSLAHDDQIEFLAPEWQRQTALGRNPEEVLGQSPPWIKK